MLIPMRHLDWLGNTRP
jgi:uncharacterized membrane protein YtjA (UPF0391 family)